MTNVKIAELPMTDVRRWLDVAYVLQHDKKYVVRDYSGNLYSYPMPSDVELTRNLSLEYGDPDCVPLTDAELESIRPMQEFERALAVDELHVLCPFEKSGYGFDVIICSALSDGNCYLANSEELLSIKNNNLLQGLLLDMADIKCAGACSLENPGFIYYEPEEGVCFPLAYDCL